MAQKSITFAEFDVPQLTGQFRRQEISQFLKGPPIKMSSRPCGLHRELVQELPQDFPSEFPNDPGTVRGNSGTGLPIPVPVHSFRPECG